MIQRCIFFGILAAFIGAGYGLYVLGIGRAFYLFLFLTASSLALLVLLALATFVYGCLCSLWIYAGKLALQWETRSSV